MIANPLEYEKAQDELRRLEDWLKRLHAEHPLPAKGLTKAGIRKMIVRLHEELALYEGGREVDQGEATVPNVAASRADQPADAGPSTWLMPRTLVGDRRQFLKGAALVGLGALGITASVIAVARLRKNPPQTGGDQPPAGRDDIIAPAHCTSAAGAKVVTVEGVDRWDRIDYVLPADGTRIPFVLIPRKLPGDPPTFYMMVTKVSNELFAKVPTAAGAKSEWRSGGWANRKDVTAADPRFPRLPVLRVTVEEAHRFATTLGGKLPSFQEWDKAAGFLDYLHDKKRRIKLTSRGPFQDSDRQPTGPDDIAVQRAALGPKEVGTAIKDISRYGCHDMAGNGREFTRSLQLEDGREVPVEDSFPDLLVMLRGRSYAAPGPLLFADLESDFKKESQPYRGEGAASPFTGFRVVLELNSIPAR